MISWCCPAWSSCVAFSFILQINKPLQRISQSELAASPSVKSALLHCSMNWITLSFVKQLIFWKTFLKIWEVFFNVNKGHNQTRFLSTSKQWVKTDENFRKSAFLTLLLKVNYYFVPKYISSLKNVSENMQSFLLLWMKGISRQSFLIP